MAAAADNKTKFNDGAAYERFMGRWSRAGGRIFLDWLAPPLGTRWLDVGCGTGAFSELIAKMCSPESIVAIDLAEDRIEYARRLPVGQLADFRIADVLTLPFLDHSFDIVASALVINFISDRTRGLVEMRRVARPGGVIAGYVMDFANGRATGWPLTHGMRVLGLEPPPIPGAEDSSLEALQFLFEQAGLQSIEVRTIEVVSTFENFGDYWASQTPGFSPYSQLIASLLGTDRVLLREAVSAALPAGMDGSITYSTRANAIKARVPK